MLDEQESLVKQVAGVMIKDEEEPCTVGQGRGGLEEIPNQVGVKTLEDLIDSLRRAKRQGQLKIAKQTSTRTMVGVKTMERKGIMYGNVGPRKRSQLKGMQ